MRRMSRRYSGVVGCLAVTTAALGCDGATLPAQVRGVSEASEPIIGGFPADAASLDAVGALAFAVQKKEQDGEVIETYSLSCTASLVGPTLVLTAEHCMRPGWDVRFVIGSDLSNPKRAVRVAGWDAERTLKGGFTGLGSDVAVVHLMEPVDDITPLAIGSIAEGDVGTEMIGIGYGVQDNDRTFGTRRAGAMEIRAIRGNPVQAIYGSFDGWKEAAFEGFRARLPGKSDEEVEQIMLGIYEQVTLLQGYEAVVGHAPGNAQACFGDSGGPLLSMSNGELTVHAVTSGGFFDNDLICAMGIYATLGALDRELIERERACPLVPAEGKCEGTTAVRCSNASEGPRRRLETDCSLFGLVCGFGESGGEVACIDDACAPLEAGCQAEGLTCKVRGGAPTCVDPASAVEACIAYGEFINELICTPYIGDPELVCSDEDSLFPAEYFFCMREALACDGNILLSEGAEECDQYLPPPPLFDPTLSCEGFCGGRSEADGRYCYCDDKCSDLSDCCDDYPSVCSGSAALRTSDIVDDW